MESKENDNCEVRKVLDLSKYAKQILYNFDYEINFVKPDSDNGLFCKMYYKDETTKTYRIINYNTCNDKLKPIFKGSMYKTCNDKLIIESEGMEEPPLSKSVKKASCIKRLVSKQKRRLQTEDFDLDMAYITDHVLAMGFPATGCEKMYRNSIVDVSAFFKKYHNNNVKIYNLCIEKERIYEKSLFSECEVGLFPATDHNPCPIKLILEFCIDLCLYLIRKPEGLAAVHCKAGKGRTGVMICSYLVFSELCSNSDEAFEYYAKVRTKNGSGITIPSQQRYIKYFESFLESNFCKPYKFLIPTIISKHFNHDNKVTNILNSFIRDNSYFTSPNSFQLKALRVGPLPANKKLSFQICDFVNSKMTVTRCDYNEENHQKISNYIFRFPEDLPVHSDIKISINGFCNFYVWVNLWYASWARIKSIFEDKVRSDRNKLSSSQMPNEGKSERKLLTSTSIEPEDEDIHNGNFLIDIHSDRYKGKSNLKEDEDNHVRPDTEDTLFDILCKLQHNTDLNEVINKINKIKPNVNLDPKNLYIKLGPDELDKFEEKNQLPNLGLTIFYTLIK